MYIVSRLHFLSQGDENEKCMEDWYEEYLYLVCLLGKNLILHPRTNGRAKNNFLDKKLLQSRNPSLLHRIT